MLDAALAALGEVPLCDPRADRLWVLVHRARNEAESTEALRLELQTIREGR